MATFREGSDRPFIEQPVVGLVSFRPQHELEDLEAAATSFEAELR